MSHGNLATLAADLPAVWRSTLLGSVGNANIKLIKMGGEGIPEESHAEFDELLVVIDGEMPLIVGDKTVLLSPGDYYLIPAGATHRVPPGSYGTLLLVDRE
ncbi:cupin domain-containing protein [Erwinia sp. INIA-01]|uniref:cupin domain-containing protein n=1 Tax=unclassified Erwinia TaxID=2622719 RepID=UPI002225029D|nr:cupin domain-containing protein [Erwinia sp. INIA01]MCW1876862.1 cupin domain-containing protein [Erwinia sp. INIA01]